MLLSLIIGCSLQAGACRSTAQTAVPRLSQSQNQTLQQIVVAAKENRGKTKPAGISVLFYCPDSKRKTVAAESLAKQLGRYVYRVNLDKLVSQYIGETEKNLQAAFAEAAARNSILFFDEADALFGKRSEVKDSHDRYANLEINYLLQRIESYDGITILSIERKRDIDEAFTRRLRFAVDFCEQ